MWSCYPLPFPLFFPPVLTTFFLRFAVSFLQITREVEGRKKPRCLSLACLLLDLLLLLLLLLHTLIRSHTYFIIFIYIWSCRRSLYIVSPPPSPSPFTHFVLSALFFCHSFHFLVFRVCVFLFPSPGFVYFYTISLPLFRAKIPQILFCSHFPAGKTSFSSSAAFLPSRPVSFSPCLCLCFLLVYS